MGTPTQVWSTLTRVWTVAPTSEEIVQDISAFPRVLEIIRDKMGCIVPDISLRSGRREMRADESGPLVGKR